jgi:hypothetical protein
VKLERHALHVDRWQPTRSPSLHKRTLSGTSSLMSQGPLTSELPITRPRTASCGADLHRCGAAHAGNPDAHRRRCSLVGQLPRSLACKHSSQLGPETPRQSERDSMSLLEEWLSASSSSTGGLLAASPSLLDMPCAHARPGLRAADVQHRLQSLQQHMHEPDAWSTSMIDLKRLSPFPTIGSTVNNESLQGSTPASEVRALHLRVRRSPSPVSTSASPLSLVETPLTDCLRAFFDRRAAHCSSEISHSLLSDPQTCSAFSNDDVQPCVTRDTDQQAHRQANVGASNVAGIGRLCPTAASEVDGTRESLFEMVRRFGEAEDASMQPAAPSACAGYSSKDQLASMQESTSPCAQQSCTGLERTSSRDPPCGAGRPPGSLSVYKPVIDPVPYDSSALMPIAQACNAGAASCAENLRQRYRELVSRSSCSSSALPSCLREPMPSVDCHHPSLPAHPLKASSLAHTGSATLPLVWPQASSCDLSDRLLGNKPRWKSCSYEDPAHVTGVRTGPERSGLPAGTVTHSQTRPTEPKIEGLSERAQQLVANAHAQLARPSSPSNVSEALSANDANLSSVVQAVILGDCATPQGHSACEAARGAASSVSMPLTAEGFCKAGKDDSASLAPAVPKALLACNLSLAVLDTLHEAFSTEGKAPGTNM